MDIEPTLADHADETFAFLEDVEMWRYYAHQRPRSLEALRETYARRAQGPADPQQRWENWILRDVVSRDAIGDLQATISCDTREASIAYGVFPPFRRRGYAREAVVTLLEHLRAAHGVERALAEIDTQNTPSLRLVRSLGFLPTGRSGEETLFERRLV